MGKFVTNAKLDRTALEEIVSEIQDKNDARSFIAYLERVEHAVRLYQMALLVPYVKEHDVALELTGNKVEVDAVRIGDRRITMEYQGATYNVTPSSIDEVAISKVGTYQTLFATLDALRRDINRLQESVVHTMELGNVSHRNGFTKKYQMPPRDLGGMLDKCKGNADDHGFHDYFQGVFGAGLNGIQEMWEPYAAGFSAAERKEYGFLGVGAAAGLILALLHFQSCSPPKGMPNDPPSQMNNSSQPIPSNEKNAQGDQKWNPSPNQTPSQASSGKGKPSRDPRTPQPAADSLEAMKEKYEYTGEEGKPKELPSADAIEQWYKDHAKEFTGKSQAPKQMPNLGPEKPHFPRWKEPLALSETEKKYDRPEIVEKHVGTVAYILDCSGSMGFPNTGGLTLADLVLSFSKMKVPQWGFQYPVGKVEEKNIFTPTTNADTLMKHFLRFGAGSADDVDSVQRAGYQYFTYANDKNMPANQVIFFTDGGPAPEVADKFIDFVNKYRKGGKVDGFHIINISPDGDSAIKNAIEAAGGHYYNVTNEEEAHKAAESIIKAYEPVRKIGPLKRLHSSLEREPRYFWGGNPPVVDVGNTGLQYSGRQKRRFGNHARNAGWREGRSFKKSTDFKYRAQTYGRGRA